MKSCILSLLFIMLLGNGKAQDNYFVTVVKGMVTRIDGTKLKTGTKIGLTDNLVFASKNDMVILLHPTKGRFVVSAASATASGDNKVTVLIKDYLQLHAQNVRLSSRGINDNMTSLEDRFRTNDSINNKILLIGTLRFRFTEREYSNVNNTENFFFLQLAATIPVSHRLRSVNKVISISREDIVFNDTLYSSDMGILHLGYLENFSGEKKATLVTNIDPVYISREECGDIIRGIKNCMTGVRDTEILNEIYTQLYYLYGKPDEQTIEQLYKRF